MTTRNQQVARVDHETDTAPSGDVHAGLRTLVTPYHSRDALVLSDYRKGVVSPAIIAAAVAAADGRRIPVLVDPKVPQAERYRGVVALYAQPSRGRADDPSDDASDDDARRAGGRARIHRRTGASVIITRGEHGMWVLDAAASP